MYSLRKRLLISATILLLLFLGIMGLVLNRAFEQSVLSNAEDALRNQILLLIANIEFENQTLLVPKVLPEPRLSQVDSDLFAQISINTSAGPKVVWRSTSLLGKTLAMNDSELGTFNFFAEYDKKSDFKTDEWQGVPKMFASNLGVSWQEDNFNQPFTVHVAEHSKSYMNSLKRFQRTIGLSLLALGALLISLLLILLGWALNPLKRVARQVREIEQGERQRFDENYPLEVSSLTQNLNQLISFDEKRINRQKEVLGNLAHSLKTPIAVLRGLNFSNELEAEALQQIGRMQTIIDYQLQSASAVGRRRFTKPILIKAITQRIVDSLQKVHIEKNVSCKLTVAPELLFFGDEGDWMELAGNLIDNAFKWAKTNIIVVIEPITLSEHRRSHQLSTRTGIKITVDDDGPGIDEELRQSILERGVRLDSQTAGHGIGLHIVKGIVEAYDGELTLSNSIQVGAIASSNFGARFTITLN